MEEEVHPENVDPDVVGVRSQPGQISRTISKGNFDAGFNSW